MTKQEIDAMHRINHSEDLCSRHDTHSEYGVLAAIQFLKEHLLNQEVFQKTRAEMTESNFCSRNGGIS